MPSRLRRAFAAALPIALALSGTVTVGGSTVSAAARPCSVVNTATHVTYSNLQKAIGKAGPGKTLRVTGTCVGNFQIGKNLTLREGTQAGVLKGNGGATLRIAQGKTVRLFGLVVTGGKAPACAEWTNWGCGGGIYNNGTLTLDGTTVKGNTATLGSSGSFGAGIYNAPSGTLTLLHSTVTRNTSTHAQTAQAAGIANDGTLNVRSSTISGNIATSDTGEAEGGGILNDSGMTSAGHKVVGIVTIVNSTVVGNKAIGALQASGGGIVAWYHSGPMTITSSTVAGNIVSGPAASGGGIENVPPGGVVSVGSTIVAGNSGPDGPDCGGSPITTNGYNLVGKGDGCSGLTDGVNHDQVGSIATPLVAKLGTLANNGGGTMTRALLVGSPAINAAGPAPCDTAKDQRGVTRPNGLACDVGAFEKN